MASNRFLELRQDEEETKRNPFLALRKPPNPEMLRLIASSVKTAHTPQVQLRDLPLPQITPTSPYAASEAFRDILRRYRDFGDEGLTQEELGQVGAAVKHIPQVAEFVTAVKKLRSDVERVEKEEAKGERIPRGGEAVVTSWEKGIGQNLDKLPDYLKNLYTTINDWVYSPAEYEPGQPEYIEQVAKVALRWPADMGNHLYEEIKKYGPTVGPIRFGASLLKFPFAVGTQAATYVTGEKIADVTRIESWTVPDTTWHRLEAEAPSPAEVMQQWIEDPLPIILVAIPLLKVAKPKIAHLKDYYTLRIVERAEIGMENVLDRKIKAGEITNVNEYEGVVRKIGEKPKIEAAEEPQFAEIRQMPPGELLSQALELQRKEGYSPAELAELYSRDREFVENIVSGGRIGKRPLIKEELAKPVERKPKAEPEPKARKEPEEMTAEEYEAAWGFDEAREREIVRIESEIMENTKPGGLAKIQTEATRAGLTRQEYLDHLRWREETKNWEPFTKPPPAKAKEPAVPKEATEIRARINEIETDIARRERWLDELADAKDKASKEFALKIKAQIAEREVMLDAAKQDLLDVMEKPEPPPELPTKPTPEGRPESATARERPEPTPDMAKVEKAAEKPAEVPPTPVETPEMKLDTEVFRIDRSELNVDTKRFQFRMDAFAKATLKRILAKFEPAKLDPLVIWRDPKDGNYYLVSGHSRFEAAKKLGIEELPVREFKGTEQEAIRFARESNLGAEAYSLAEKVNVYRQMEKDGATKKELKLSFGADAGKIEAYTYLNPQGKFMEYLDQQAWDSFPHLTQKARDAGDIRRNFPELTNRHEDQIFDAFYPTDSKSRRYLDMRKGDFARIVERQVMDLEWVPNKPLKFGRETVEGLVARPDTRETMAKIKAIKEDIKRVKKDKGMKGVAEYIQGKQAELDRLYKLIEDYAEDQLSLVIEEIKPIEKMTGGLGAVNPFQTMNQKLARKLREIRGKREKAIEGKIAYDPSFFIQRKPKDLGPSHLVRTTSNLFGVAEKQPARYGEVPRAVATDILLTDRDIMTEAGIRGEVLESILARVDKKDWGKHGEKFWDHVENPSWDSRLQPSSREAAVMIRDVMESALQEIIGRFRDRVRPSVEKLVNREWREPRDLTGKKLNPAQKAELEEAIEAEIINRIPDEWGIRDYLPHMQPGTYEIKRMEMGPNGDVIHTHVGSAGNSMRALTKALEDYADHPEAAPDSYILVPRVFRGDEITRVSRPKLYHIINEIANATEKAITPEKVADFLRGTIGARESKQKFASFVQKRKGEPGYSKELVPVLSVWNQTFTRWKHASDLNKRVQPLLQKIRAQGQPNVANRLESDFMQVFGRPPTEASLLLDNCIQKIPTLRDYARPMLLERTMGYVKGGSATVFIKWNPRFNLIVNRFQRFQTTLPVLEGAPFSGQWLEGTRFYKSPEGKAAMESFGIGHITGGKILEAGRTWTKRKTREKLGTLAAETSNQEIAWCTMYMKAKKMGMSEVAANDYAFINGCLHTQFCYLPSDVPPLMRGPLLSTALQFKRFTVKNLELGYDLIADRNYAGAAKWLGAQILLGGTRVVTKPIVGIAGLAATLGIPYADKVGYITSEAYKGVKEEAGEFVADLIAYGLPSILGLDLSYSIMMWDVAYGETIPEKIANLFLGPFGTTAVSVGTWGFYTKGYEPNPLRRMFDATIDRIPAFRWIEALDQIVRGADAGQYDFRDPAGRLRFKGDIKDVIKRGLAGRTVEEGWLDITTEALTSVNEQRDKVLDMIAMKIIRDVERARALDFSDKYKWNELWPQFEIDDRAIFDRLRTRYKFKDWDRLQRLLYHMPKVFKYQQGLE